MTYIRRLKKELVELQKNPPPGVRLDESVLEDNLSEYVLWITIVCVDPIQFNRWIIHMSGPSSSLYEGEDFRLLFKFSQKYPFDSPQVCDHY